MWRRAAWGLAAGLIVAAGCAERPRYADLGAARKADENRIRAIESNPNLTQAQKEWQINRIKGQMPPQQRK